MRAKRPISMLLVLCMLLSLMPTASLAQESEGTAVPSIVALGDNDNEVNNEEKEEDPTADEGQDGADSQEEAGVQEEDEGQEETGVPMAIDEDGGDEDDKETPSETTYVAKIGEQGYATLQAAIDAAQKDDTILLTANITATGHVNIARGQKLTLDLNGKTLSMGAYVVGVLGDLTIQDSGTGGKMTGAAGKVIQLGKSDDDGEVAGVLTVNGGTIENTQTSGGAAYGVAVFAGSTATVNGGTIIALDAALSGNNTLGDMNFVVTAKNGDDTTVLTARRGPAIYMPGQVSMTITGGTLNGGVSLRMGQVNISGGIFNATTGEIDTPSGNYTYGGNAWFPDALYVFGGTYTSDNEEYHNSLNLNITGGTFNCTNNSGSAVAIYDLGKVSQTMNVTISGGTFNTTTTGRNAYAVLSLSDIGVSSPASGYGNKDYVGKVQTSITGGTYSTDPTSSYIKEGYSATQIGDVYVVHADTDAARIGTTYYATLVNALAAAKDGQTVTLVQDASEGVSGKSNPTINKNITLDLDQHTLTGLNQCAIVVSGATATIRNGTLKGGSLAPVAVQSKGTLTLDNVTATNTAGKYTLYVLAGSTLNVKSGTYNCGSGVNAPVLYCVGTANVSDGTFSGSYGGLVAGAGTLNVDGGSFTGTSSGIQAQIGGTLNVTKGTVSGGTSGVAVINMAGYNDTTVNISGGTVKGTGNGANSNGVAISGCTTVSDRAAAKATVTISDKAEVSGVKCGVMIEGLGAVLNVEGGTIKGGSYGITGNGTKNDTTDCGGTVINIKGGTIQQTGESGGAIYHPQDGTLNISGDAEISGKSGIQMCSGEGMIVSITGGSVTATGDDLRASKTGDGFINDGAAVSIVDRSYPGGTPRMTITGGTFISKGTTDYQIENGTKTACQPVLAYAWSNNTASQWATANQFLSISGGSYSGDVSDYLAPGYICLAQGNGVYKVQEDQDLNYVASVGTTKYVTLAAAIEAATAQGATNHSVTLLDDVTVDSTITLTGALNLDLNGKTITNNVKNGRLFAITGAVAVTVNANGGKMVIPETNENCYGFFDVKAAATLTLNGGSYTGDTDDGAFVDVTVTGAAVTLTDLTVTAKNAVLSCGENGTDLTLTVTGGSYTSDGTVFQVNAKNTENAVTFNKVTVTKGTTAVALTNGKATLTDCNFGSAVTVDTGATVTISSGSYTDLTNGTGSVTISGGTFSGSLSNGSGSISISGGTFDGNLSNGSGSISVSSGTFNATVDSKYLADDHVCVDMGDNVYQVMSTEAADALYMAKVGENDKYLSLADALEKGTVNDKSGYLEITLLQNVTEAVSIPEGKKVKLDLGTHTLSSDNATATITVSKDGELVLSGTGTVDNSGKGVALKNEGTVVLRGATLDRTGETSNVHASTVTNSGKLTVYTGTVRTAGGKENLGTDQPLVTNSGTLTVAGGTFKGGSYVIENTASGGKKGLTVTGGTFTNFRDGAVTNSGDATVYSGEFTGTVAVDNSGTLTIYNGTVKGLGAAVRNTDAGKATISGGTFTGDMVGTFSLTGGTYTVDVSTSCAKDVEKDLGDGQKETVSYAASLDKDGFYTVSQIQEVKEADKKDVNYDGEVKADTQVKVGNETMTAKALAEKVVDEINAANKNTEVTQFSVSNNAVTDAYAGTQLKETLKEAGIDLDNLTKNDTAEDNHEATEKVSTAIDYDVNVNVKPTGVTVAASGAVQQSYNVTPTITATVTTTTTNVGTGEVDSKEKTVSKEVDTVSNALTFRAGVSDTLVSQLGEKMLLAVDHYHGTNTEKADANDMYQVLGSAGAYYVELSYSQFSTLVFRAPTEDELKSLVAHKENGASYKTLSEALSAALKETGSTMVVLDEDISSFDQTETAALQKLSGEVKVYLNGHTLTNLPECKDLTIIYVEADGTEIGGNLEVVTKLTNDDGKLVDRDLTTKTVTDVYSSEDLTLTLAIAGGKYTGATVSFTVNTEAFEVKSAPDMTEGSPWSTDSKGTYTYTYSGTTVDATATNGETIGTFTFTPKATTGEAVPVITVTESKITATSGTDRTRDVDGDVTDKKVSVKVINKTMTVTAADVSVDYDGQAHSITVNAPDGATIVYDKSSAEGEYGESTSPTYTAAGEYTVYYKVTLKDYDDVTGSAKVTIAAVTNTWAPEPTVNGQTEGTITLDYTGNPVSYTTPTADYGTVSVKWEKKNESGDWSEIQNVPSAAGNYKVTFAVPETTSYNGLSKTISFEISKTDAAGVTAPVAADLTYNGTERQLLQSLGASDKGTIYYAKTDTATAPASNSWGEALNSLDSTIFKATNAGVYYLWYRLKGDENHQDTEWTRIADVEIKKDAVKADWVTVPESTTRTINWNGDADVALVEGIAITDAGKSAVADLKLEYSTDGGETWSTDVPTATALGTVTVSYRFTAANYEKVGTPITVTVALPEALAALTASRPSYYGASDGSISGTTTGMVYGTTTNYESASDCTATSTTGLTAGTYYVWMKDHPGVYATVVVPAGPSSSGSGGSGSSSSTANKTETATETVTGTTAASVSMEAVVTESTASLSVKDADLQTAIQNVGEAGSVVLDLTSLSPVIKSVVIPVAAVLTIADAALGDAANVSGMSLRLADATLTFDAGVLQVIKDQAGAGDVTVHADNVGLSGVNEAQQKAMAGMTSLMVLDLSLAAGDTLISDFKGGKAELTVTPELEPGMTMDDLSVWYVATDGQRTRIPHTVSGSEVHFTVEHFSNYIVAYGDQSSAYDVCPKDDTCPLAAFTDVDVSAWYHDAVHYALQQGLMNGTGDDTFAPGLTTSRAMIATMLYRLEGSPALTGGKSFTDVTEGLWYTAAVLWAAENGLVDGYGDGSFGPEDPITREQMAAILYRYAGYKGYDRSETGDLTAFTDSGETSTWAQDALAWAVGAKLLSGKGDGILDPAGQAIRAEVAQIFMNYLLNIAE